MIVAWFLVVSLACFALATLFVSRRVAAQGLEDAEPPVPVEPEQPPVGPVVEARAMLTADDLDPEVQAARQQEDLADLLARANEMAGGRYLAINVGPSRHERRAAKAIAKRATRKQRA